MIGRVATFQTNSSLLQQTMRLQTKLADAQSEQASGLQSDAYSGLSGKVSALLAFNSQAARLNADISTSQAFAQKIDQAYASLSSITELAASMRTSIAAQQSNSSDTNLAAEAAQWREDLASLLNTQIGGDYVFAGAATNTKPVDLSAQTAGAGVDSADTSYYLGADTRLSQTGFTYSTDLPVSAGDSGFEKLFRAGAMIAANPDDPDTLTAAYDLVTAAIEEVAAAQAKVSARAASLESFQTQATARVDAVQGFADDMKNADLAEATLKVAQYQTQLEAAYSSLTVLMKTNLLDYL